VTTICVVNRADDVVDAIIIDFVIYRTLCYSKSIVVDTEIILLQLL